TKSAKIDKSKPPKNMYVEKDGQLSMIEGGTRRQYIYPPISLLKESSSSTSQEDAQKEIYKKSEKLVETLETFGVKTRIIGVHRGPSVTRYELQPAAGVKVKQITNLADDIALNLAANGVRIEAPIPGKAAIGVEIPNNHRDGVSMRELIDSEEYRNAKGKLSFAVGKNIEGKIIIGDISTMPHMLIAGTTGSGKSVFTNSIIMNVLYHSSPDEVKLILIDPKKVEFPIYNGIPHLLIPVVTDPLKAAGALSWAVNEMMRRYKLFEANGTKNLEDYNRFVKENPEREKKIEPQILIIVDEFADLMLASKSEVEESVMRLAQLARAAGMHMIIATQSPRVDVLTGIIKANIPSRTALSVANNTDSRVILDETGAEKLLGRGDMLYKPVHFPKPMRIQGAFASTEEIRNVVKFIKDECSADYSEEVIRAVDENTPQPKNTAEVTELSGGGTDDELTNRAITIIVETGNASTAFLQRKLKLGFPRAARIMDEIEEMGIVGPQEGSKPRKINITKEEWYERQSRS
ncbi:MAG: DNA translocase FtsK, partial [Oscillospiraceae bacterium]